ncbi:MAG: hypothetical protein AMXMBFR47_35730 [Planctomycetota bacterium]
MEVHQARHIATTALNDLAEALERGQSEPFKRYLAAMSRFHTYSPRNIMLIRNQRAHTEQVASYSTWKRLGRSIMRGERGIAILAPIPRRSLQSAQEAKTDADEASAREQADRDVAGFRTAYVFGVEQTIGAPLPEPPRVGGDPGRFLERLKRFAADKHIALEYSSAIAPARGVSTCGKIILLPNMTPAEEYSTLGHELTHELLHDRSARLNAGGKQLRELEAEAVAFVVCRGIGLESGATSADYILHYNGDRIALSRSLARIQRTASEILTAISDI